VEHLHDVLVLVYRSSSLLWTAPSNFHPYSTQITLGQEFIPLQHVHPHIWDSFAYCLHGTSRFVIIYIQFRMFLPDWRYLLTSRNPLLHTLFLVRFKPTSLDLPFC